MKIVLFGDSLLARMGKDLINSLEKAIPDSDVYNCSAGGWDSNDGVKKAPFISKLKPNIVIINFGTNDSAAWKQVPIEQYIKNLAKIFENFKGSRIIYFLPPPVNPANGHDADHWRLPESFREYHEEARTLLDKLGIEYLNSYAIFGPMLDKDENYHLEDGVHFNDHGYEVLIKEFARVINK